MSRKILVTSALPYANGAIHLGHLVEYIQTDIWVRFQKMSGHTCYYVCADDNHGTPVMLRAEREGISPEELTARVHEEHKADFDGFHIGFDEYYRTHSPETKEFAELFFKRLSKEGLIETRTIEQFYDPAREMFLPDRFIKGECPKCHAKDQYGDNCEVCGATYQPTELINPYSAVTGATPELRQSDHYFFRLSDPRCIEFLKGWIPNRLQPEAANKINEWFVAGLSDWDISRDAPYFGFKIPDTENKYFYVWMDAPIGYMGTFKKLCERTGLDFDEFWNRDSKAELYHFIGKDILYFHALFWPSELHFADFRAPTKIFCHGFLTVNGQKMSKSRGTFITAASYLNFIKNPAFLRYYYAAKLNDSLEDIDLNLDDFVSRVNSDLVGKYVNIASRSAKFLQKYFENTLSAAPDNYPLLTEVQQAGYAIAQNYNSREYSKAVREIMRLADLANQYIDSKKPWEIAKTNPQSPELHAVCSAAINLFRLLTIYLKPVLPETAEKVEVFLNIPPLTWTDSEHLLIDHTISPYTHLMARVDANVVQAMVDANKEAASLPDSSSAKGDKGDKTPSAEKAVSKENTGFTPAPIASEISIEDFKKLDLRIGVVKNAEDVQDSKKLLRLTVDLGNETRNIFSGVKPNLKPEDLIGKKVIIVANLAPRKMKFGVSEGMMLLAASDNDQLSLITSETALPGMKVE